VVPEGDGGVLGHGGMIPDPGIIPPAPSLVGASTHPTCWTKSSRLRACSPGVAIAGRSGASGVRAVGR
jgi:hypothetical protein